MGSSRAGLVFSILAVVVAVRRDLVEKTGTDSKPSRSASALQKLLAAQSQRITPGVKDKLTGVKASLDGQVSGQIKSAHNGANQEVSNKVDILETATSKLMADSSESHNKHNTWVNCVKDERSMLTEYESDMTKLGDLRDIQKAKKELEVKAEPFSASTTTLKLKCNIFLSPDCMKELMDLRASKTQAVEAVKTNMNSKQQVYDTAKAESDAAIQAADDQEKKAKTQYENYETKSEACVHAKGDRDNHMCNTFGKDFLNKCKASEDYTKVVSDIGAKGNALSHPDRVSEWESTQLTSCLLGKFISDSPVDQQAITECKSGIDFGKQVGTIDFKTAKYSDLMSPTSFTCKETEIVFQGNWKLPVASEKTVRTTSEYVQGGDYTVPVNLQNTKSALPLSCSQ